MQERVALDGLMNSGLPPWDAKPLYGWTVWRRHYDGDGPDVVVDHFTTA